MAQAGVMRSCELMAVSCVYWPPYYATHILKYDPDMNLASLVGNDFVRNDLEWYGGALTPDGVSHLKYSNNPWGEFLETTKANMEAHPEKFGFLFQKITRVGEGYALHESQTNFDHAVV